MFLKKSKLKIISNSFQKIVSATYKFKLVKTTTNFSKFIFPYLYVITNALLLIELITYKGLIFRYLFLNTTVMMLVTIASFLFMIFTLSDQSQKFSDLTDFVLKFNKLVLIPLVLINYLLISFDDFYYPNYVYSKFHINPNNFQLILSFNLFIFVIVLLIRFKGFSSFIYRLIATKSIVHIVFFITVAVFSLSQIQIVSGWMYHASFKMIRTISFSWKEKLIYLNGGEAGNGWIVLYTDFVNKYSDPQATIFIPPQKESWQMEGNQYYLRWFIYPRHTVQATDIVAPIPENADLVLIDNGAWPGMKEYGWPRVAIEADQIEEIIFIDRETKEVTTVKNQAYDPETMSYKWGLIKLKK